MNIHDNSSKCAVKASVLLHVAQINRRKMPAVTGNPLIEAVSEQVPSDEEYLVTPAENPGTN